MHKRSPLILHVTLEQLRRGADLCLADCLRMERAMVRRCFEHGEVMEGKFAAGIDEDDTPHRNADRQARLLFAQISSTSNKRRCSRMA